MNPAVSGVESAFMDSSPERAPIDLEFEEESGKSAVFLAALLVAVSVLAILYGLQCLIYLEAKSWGRAHPELYDTPQPLPVPAATLSAKRSTPLAFYGYEFSVPWAENPQVEDTGAPFQRIRFVSGQVVVFYDPGKLLNTAGALKGSAPTEYQQLVNVFGEHPFISNADLYQEVYKASPAQLSPFEDRRRALRANTLLLWKLAFDGDGRGGIFSFDWGTVRGLQFADPEKSPFVDVRAFDASDQQFRFLFCVAAGSAAKLTQEEISETVSSLRPVPISAK